MNKQDLAVIAGMTGKPVDTRDIALHLRRVARDVRLPDLSIGICLVRIEDAAPRLLELLVAAADGRSIDADDDLLFFRGLHILGAARVTAAFAPLLRLLQRPPEEIDDLLGDALTETVPRIVIGTFDGDADALLAAVADPDVDEMVRHVLLAAAGRLTFDGRIERETMVAFLERFGERRPAPKLDIVWEAWHDTVALLGLHHMVPLVERIRRAGFIESPEGARVDFVRMLAEAGRAPGDPGRFEALGLGPIDDILDALGRFVAEEPTANAVPDGDADWLPPAPAVNPLRGVGRNDPCPCGSGRKAKKCCLAT